MASLSVCVIGVGGLGCPASLALLHAGALRELTLVDPDVVELSNLHRQLWHTEADLGRPKVKSAASKIRQQFPSVAVRTLQQRVTALDAEALFAAHQVVIDATDGVETKFMLSDTAVRTGTTLIYGGVLRLEGLALRIERGGPCLRCLFESPPDEAPSCAQAGVMGSMAGVIGALQATLALTPNPRPGETLVHVVDGARFEARIVTLRRRSDCAVCNSAPTGRDPTLHG